MNIRNMALCSMFAALMAVCAWIYIPFGDLGFTLQTFALFLCLSLLGGRLGSITCVIYLLLGAVGLPVFSGFRGGLGVLLGATGGYIVGFLAAALCFWGITAALGKRPIVCLLAQILGLFVCYGVGTVWYLALYLDQWNAATIAAVTLRYVVPFLLPDGIKLFLARLLSRRLKRYLYA